eukprot:scaffold609_cov234-Pinguiococcus_pyrenoidosus.AAC.7
MMCAERPLLWQRGRSGAEHLKAAGGSSSAQRIVKNKASDFGKPVATLIQLETKANLRSTFVHQAACSALVHALVRSSLSSAIGMDDCRLCARHKPTIRVREGPGGRRLALHIGASSRRP